MRLELKRHGTGQAYIRYQGKCVYFGKFGEPATLLKFQQWLERMELEQKNPHKITLLELFAQFMKHAKEHYVKDGEITGEVKNFQVALRTAAKLFGNLLVLDFGPKRLKEIRDRMIADGLARNSINARIRRIRHVFKWGVSEQLVPTSILVGLQAVNGLQAGRTAARETEPVGPVAELKIEAVKPFVSRQIWGLICFMRLTGARPGEAVRIRWCDIDAEGPVWLYSPARHKTQHRGKRRVIAIGPEAQKVLNQFPGNDTDYVFRPQQALEEFSAANYGDSATVRQVGDRYSMNTLPAILKIACERAFDCPKELTTAATRKRLRGESPDAFAERKKLAAEWRAKNCWHWGQLRHNAATRMRMHGGIDVAQVGLGHSSVKTTERYAEMNIDAAIRFAAEFG